MKSRTKISSITGRTKLLPVSIDGDYIINFDGEELCASIDTENQRLEIGDWNLEGEDAMEAITEIYHSYIYSHDTVGNAIEQYAYDASR